jgi:hypothetical protein
MGNIEQLIRIGLFTAGGYLLGDGIAQSAEFQGAVGGIMQVGTFVWWMIRNRAAAR